MNGTRQLVRRRGGRIVKDLTVPGVRAKDTTSVLRRCYLAGYNDGLAGIHASEHVQFAGGLLQSAKSRGQLETAVKMYSAGQKVGFKVFKEAHK